MSDHHEHRTVTDPTVSVVVPTYGRADLLPRAVDSVLAQTVDDLEVVVVDDASTDDTAAVVAGYDDDRVRYFAHETNRGGSAARNTGIERARGEYVAFLDDDDEWRPTKLERQFERLADEDEEWVGAYCDHVIVPAGPTGRLQRAVADVLAGGGPDHPVEGGEELITQSLANNVNSGAGSTLIVRTEVARRVDGFDESLDRFEDPDFLIRVLVEGKVAYVDEPLVVRHGTPTPPAETVRTASEQFRAKFADEVAATEREGYAVHASHRLLLAKRFLEEGRFREGIGYALRAAIQMRQYPGLCWSAATGLYVRRRRATTLLGAAAVLLVLATRSRSD